MKCKLLFWKTAREILRACLRICFIKFNIRIYRKIFHVYANCCEKVRKYELKKLEKIPVIVVNCFIDRTNEKTS